MLIYPLVEEQRRQQEIEGCSTNSTIGDCNVTNSTAAIVVRAKSKNVNICSLVTCGGGQCPIPEKRSLDNSTLDLLSKRGEPSEGDWPDPEDYDGVIEDFLRSEIIEAPDSPYSDLVELSTGIETTTSKHITFGPNFRQLVVTGLWGCTSIIVVSRRGAWASHIWQDAFESNPVFQTMAINKVHVGDGTDPHEFGIDELMNRANDSPRGVIFGDNTNSDDKPNVKVIIVTPRKAVALTDKSGFTSDIVRDNPHVNFREPPTYGDRVLAIEADLKNTFGQDVPIEVVTYAPRVETNEQSDQLNLMHNFGQTAREADKREEVKRMLTDREVRSHRGKAIVQYRPSTSCHKAEWRIFVETMIVKEPDSWDPSPTQSYNPEQ